MVHVVRLSFLGLRFMIPWVFRAAVFTLTTCLMVVASLWVGVPNACRAIAQDWVDRALRAGFPDLYVRYLYGAVYAIALAVILASWFLFAFITVFLVGLIF